MLTGVRLEIDGEQMTLAATDRYRLAVRELTWQPADPSAQSGTAVLVPARALADAARSLAHSDVLTIALSGAAGTGSGEGIIGFSGTANGRSSRATTRLLDATFPAYRSLLPNDWASSAEVPVAPLVEAVRRAALVTDRNAPVRMEFTDAVVTLTAGGDESADSGRAEEQLEIAYEGDPITTAFNPQFLLDGLGALTTPTARMLFTSSTKPVVLRPATADSGESTGEAADGTTQDYTYLIMPVRLPG
jgi:DNA polymerase-3 subunit beta